MHLLKEYNNPKHDQQTYDLVHLTLKMVISSVSATKHYQPNHSVIDEMKKSHSLHFYGAR